MTLLDCHKSVNLSIPQSLFFLHPAHAIFWPMARPSLYTPELVELICSRLATGEPLAQICRSEGMPSHDAVSDWCEKYESVKRSIARARDLGEEAIAADCLSIADDSSNDKYKDENGYMRTNAEVVQRSKLRVETRLKLLSKWNPKKWGERVAMELDASENLAAVLLERRRALESRQAIDVTPEE